MFEGYAGNGTISFTTINNSLSFEGLALFGTSTMSGAAADLTASVQNSTTNTFPIVIVILGLLIAFYALEAMFKFFPPVPTEYGDQPRRRRSKR